MLKRTQIIFPPQDESKEECKDRGAQMRCVVDALKMENIE